MKINRNYVVGAVLIVSILIILGGWLLTRNLGTNSNSPDEELVDFFSSLFPFGDLIEEDPSTTGVATGTAGDPVVAALRKVSAGPVSGAAAFTVGSTTVIRYIDQSTGHLFETPADNTATVRLTNTTVPGAHDVVWVTKDSFILRYVSGDNGIENFLASVATSAPDQALQGRFIHPFDRIAISGDSKTLYTVTETPGGARVETSRADGSNLTTIYTSPIRSWTVLAGGTRVFLQTPPSAGALGYLYRLQGTVLEKIVGGLPGLNAKPNPNGTRILASAFGEGRPELGVYTLSNASVNPFPLPTMADKCAWQSDEVVVCGVPLLFPTADFPDSWYLGYQTTEDSVWSIDTTANISALVADLSDIAREPIDVYRPSVSEDGAYLIFLNKRDLSLWSLKLRDVVPLPQQ